MGLLRVLLALSVVLWRPTNFASEGLGAVGFLFATMTSNIFLSKQTGYFDAAAADQPLLHTWSLSVEEQFYVVLPLLLYWLHQKARRWLVPAFVVLAVLSFAWALVEAHRGTNGAYYFAQNRAFEFLLGTLLALFEFRRTSAVRSRRSCG